MNIDVVKGMLEAQNLICSSFPADPHLQVYGLPPICLAKEPL